VVLRGSLLPLPHPLDGPGCLLCLQAVGLLNMLIMQCIIDVLLLMCTVVVCNFSVVSLLCNLHELGIKMTNFDALVSYNNETRNIIRL